MASALLASMGLDKASRTPPSPQAAAQNREAITRLSRFAKKVEKVRAPQKVVVDIQDKIQMRKLSWQRLSNEVKLFAVNKNKIKEHDHYQCIEFTVDCMPDFSTVSGDLWDAFVIRMDVCYFPTNHYVSITQDGKFNTFTAKVDETKEISSYILDTAKDFLSQNETHVGVPPNLVFDPPAILKMKAEFIERMSQFALVKD